MRKSKKYTLEYDKIERAYCTPSARPKAEKKIYVLILFNFSHQILYIVWGFMYTISLQWFFIRTWNIISYNRIHLEAYSFLQWKSYVVNRVFFKYSNVVCKLFGSKSLRLIFLQLKEILILDIPPRYKRHWSNSEVGSKYSKSSCGQRYCHDVCDLVLAWKK